MPDNRRYFFDVDGVLLDFETSFVAALKAHFKIEAPEDYKPNCWYFSDWLSEAQLREGWEYFIASEHFGRLAPLVDVAEFNRVFGGGKVHMVTNIPPPSLEARRRNLEAVGIRFDSLHCGGFNSFDGGPPTTKGDVIDGLLGPGEGVFFIDDHPENCREVKARHPEAEVWLMTRPFNLDFAQEGIHRADGWPQVNRAVEEWRTGRAGRLQPGN